MNNIPLAGFHVNCAERMGQDSVGSLGKYLEMWIDKSDVVILLIGLKYGTEPDDGISWTEREFRYALDKGKPIFCYFREHPEVDIAKIDLPQKLLNLVRLVE